MIDRKTSFVRNIDWVTVIVYLVLVLMGWINIYAAVYNEDHKSIFDFSQRYGSQMIWILFGLALAVAVVMIDLKFYTFFAYIIYAFCLILLIMVLGVGSTVNGNKAWLHLGHFSIQPAEFAKVATALALAKYLSIYNSKVTNIKSLFFLGGIILLPMLLIIMQPDAGSMLVFLSFSIVLFREGLPGAILLFGVALGILMVASLLVAKIIIIPAIILIGFVAFAIYTKKYKETILGFLFFGIVFASFYGIFRLAHKHVENFYTLAISFVLAGIIMSVFAFFKRIRFVGSFVLFLSASIVFTFCVDYGFHHVLEMHQQRRMNIVLGIEKDPLGVGYNVNQSMIAIGSGGFFGKGFLQGTQTKYNFVPEQSTDFIFCTVGEEWGFVGTMVVSGLFLFLLLRIVNMAERQRSTFSRVYAYSVASILFFHFAINVGMTLGLLPVIGIPLPFFSYGGSSLWSFTILLFILIRLDASRLELLK